MNLKDYLDTPVCSTPHVRVEIIIFSIFAYITLIIQVMRLDVAWCWTSEHVYGGFLLIFCSIYLHRGKWKLKRI